MCQQNSHSKYDARKFGANFTMGYALQGALIACPACKTTNLPNPHHVSMTGVSGVSTPGSETVNVELECDNGHTFNVVFRTERDRVSLLAEVEYVLSE